MRVLVTGAGGFIGLYLVGLLADRGHRVYAGTRGEIPLASFERTGVEQVNLDILRTDQIRLALKAAKPDAIVHLAAQSNVRQSWENPSHTFEVNAVGAIHLIEAVRSVCPEAKLISIGSGEEYGAFSQAGEPLTEASPCLPQNPYAISKFAAGQLLMQMARRDRLNVVHVRPFNHFGPGQPTGFAIADFASQIARIEADGSPAILKVGNLAVRRDFTDVRDIAEAYVGLVEQEVESGIYNACSMVPRELGEIVRTLIGFSKAGVSIEVDPFKLRPVDHPVIAGSSKKLKQAIGWTPRRSFEQSLLETLEWWRKSI